MTTQATIKIEKPLDRFGNPMFLAAYEDNFVRETEKAYCITTLSNGGRKGRNCWLPKSQCEKVACVNEASGHETFKIYASGWILKMKQEEGFLL